MIKSFSQPFLLTKLINDYVTYPTSIDTIENGFFPKRAFYFEDVFTVIKSEYTDLIEYVLNNNLISSPIKYLNEAIDAGYLVYRSVTYFFRRNNIRVYAEDMSAVLQTAIKTGSFIIVRYMIEDESVPIWPNHLVEARNSGDLEIYSFLITKMLWGKK